MATQGLVQRGLKSLSNTFTAVRTGEGDGAAAKLGKSFKKSTKKAKGGFKQLGIALGLARDVDEVEDEDEGRQRRRARQLIGDDAPMFVARSGSETRDINATVAPEFRGQVAAGLAAANSMTTGSTLADAPSLGDGFDDSGGEHW